MERKPKLGWGVLRILGTVYTPLGAGFVVLGAVLTLVLPTVDKLLGVIFMQVGTPFLILGLIFLALDNRKKRRMEALVEAGRFVWAEVVDCQPNFGITYHNGIHPYRLTACYAAPDGTKHLFTSPNIRCVGVKDLIGKQVRVYADETFRHYYVDAQPLLGNYVEH